MDSRFSERVLRPEGIRLAKYSGNGRDIVWVNDVDSFVYEFLDVDLKKTGRREKQINRRAK